MNNNTTDIDYLVNNKKNKKKGLIGALLFSLTCPVSWLAFYEIGLPDLLSPLFILFGFLLFGGKIEKENVKGTLITCGGIYLVVTLITARLFGAWNYYQVLLNDYTVNTDMNKPLFIKCMFNILGIISNFDEKLALKFAFDVGFGVGVYVDITDLFKILIKDYDENKELQNTQECNSNKEASIMSKSQCALWFVISISMLVVLSFLVYVLCRYVFWWFFFLYLPVPSLSVLIPFRWFKKKKRFRWYVTLCVIIIVISICLNSLMWFFLFKTTVIELHYRAFVLCAYSSCILLGYWILKAYLLKYKKWIFDHCVSAQQQEK